jgi:hypothetical protein
VEWLNQQAAGVFAIDEAEVMHEVSLAGWVIKSASRVLGGGMNLSHDRV